MRPSPLLTYSRKVQTFMETIPLSVVIMARNEEKNIPDCLESVKGWVDEIVLVDDFSTDETLNIAKKYTDKIYQKKWELEGKSRNFAYSKASHDYILSLDCDERITPELRDEIIDIFRASPSFNGYNIPHTCCIAPLTPAATYNKGLVLLPLVPMTLSGIKYFDSKD